MQKLRVCTRACWTLTIHHRTLLSFHFDFSKNLSPLNQLFPKPPPENPPRTHLSSTVKIHHGPLSPLNVETPNPFMFFEKPYPILIFKLFPLSQIPLNQLFSIPLNQLFPNTPLLSLLNPPTRISSSKQLKKHVTTVANHKLKYQ